MIRRLLIVSALLFFAGCAPSSENNSVIRAGCFPNVTHAQALIGRADKSFEKVFAPSHSVQWTLFNAGPSAIEALFAGEIDILYVGPSPVINGYIKSGGDAIRVVAGSANGGAALVVRENSEIREIQDFHGKRIASPQLGNTQDVALRSWLAKNNLKLSEKGGDVQVLPISNADQQTLLIKKEIDAAWTVEPWVSVLIRTAGVKVFLEESSLWPDGRYATTLLAVRRQFLEEHPDLVKKWVERHVEITDWIQANPLDAQRIVNEEILKETRKALPDQVIQDSWKRIQFTTQIPEESIQQQAQAARQAGFLKKEPDLSELFSAAILEQVMDSKKKRA